MSAEIVIPCADLGEALAFFVEKLGFRVDMISPADDPSIAVVSGHGARIRLERTSAPRAREGWVEGRAGMRYRDLVPDRRGGRVIASHIRIEAGGHVPDYVHFHEVRYQVIYCLKGWVRVVYEDQGPPFVLYEGDCVLQPPRIRHRVLESSAGCEVFEIGSPARHDTFADHDMELPTSVVRADRELGGQRFVHHRASTATWRPSRLEGFEARDTGIAAATKGLVAVSALRASATEAEGRHDGELLFFFVLAGAAKLDVGNRSRALAEGDGVVIPAGERYAVRAHASLELLEVTVPGANA